MHTATGTVEDGKVVVDGNVLPGGTAVMIFAKVAEAIVHLPPSLKSAFEEALDEADRETGVSAEELIERLRRLG